MALGTTEELHSFINTGYFEASCLQGILLEHLAGFNDVKIGLGVPWARNMSQEAT